jgi:hypothetical protein
MCYGPHAIRHRGLNSSWQRLEREAQDMKRRAKVDGEKKRNVAVKK